MNCLREFRWNNEVNDLYFLASMVSFLTVSRTEIDSVISLSSSVVSKKMVGARLSASNTSVTAESDVASAGGGLGGRELKL